MSTQDPPAPIPVALAPGAEPDVAFTPVRALAPPLGATLICVYLLSIGYLPFHFLAELFAILVGVTAMIVATVSQRFTRNAFVIVWAVSLGWAACIDLAHVLAYKGMHLLPVNEANVATQLWLAARYIQAGGGLAAFAFLRRGTLSPVHLHAVFGSVAVLLLVAIFTGHFPTAFVEGVGLTPFKKISEYVIIAMFALAVPLMSRERALMGRPMRLAITATVTAMILAEFMFTQYGNVFDLANALGHLLKIFGYWFVYLALVQTTIREPFSMLARAASTYDAVPDPTLIVAANGRVIQANQAAARLAGVPAEELVGQASHSLFHAADVPPERCPVCSRMAAEEAPFTAEFSHRDGQVSFECAVAPFAPAGTGVRVQVMHDVSERKRHEAALSFLARRSEAMLELPRLADRLSEHEFLQAGLALAENLTGSQIAFAHFVHDDQISIRLTAWSRSTLEHYCTAAYDEHYPTDQAGVWADAIRTRAPVVVNDYASAPGRRGLPEGHAQLQRLISVPTLEEGRACMVFGVGNKATPYVSRDVETLQLLAEEMWRIVQQRRTEDQRRQSAAHMSTLVRAIPDPIWLKDLQGTYLACNPAFEALFGTEERDVVGHTADAFMDQGLALEIHRQDQATIAAARPSTFEEWLTYADGRRALHETFKAPVYGPKGEILGTLGIARDVTEARRLSAEREALLAAQERRVRELRALYALSTLSEEPQLDMVRFFLGVAAILPGGFARPELVVVTIDTHWGAFGAKAPAAPACSLERALRAGGEQVGTLCVFQVDASGAEGATFSPEEVELLDAVASRVGETIERLEAGRQIQRLRYLYETLSATNHAIVRCEDAESLSAALFDAFVLHSMFQILFIARVDGAGNVVRITHANGVGMAQRAALEAALGEANAPLRRHAARLAAGEIVAGPLEGDEGPPGWLDYLAAHDVRERALVPLLSEGQPWGLACLFAVGRGGFDDSQRSLLAEMASDVSFALTSFATAERRAAAEQRARQSEHRFQEVFAASPLPMMVIATAEGELRSMNRAMVDWLGYEHAEVASQAAWFERVYAPGVREAVADAWRQGIEEAARTGHPSRSPEVTLRCKDGSERIAVGTMTLVGSDAVVAWTDLTEARRNATQIAEYVRRLELAVKGTLQATSRIMDMRDPYTAGHEQGVARLASALGREMGWGEDRCAALEMSGLVHDIGKVAVPADILSMPRALSELELELVRGHVEAGYEILKDVPLVYPVADIVRQHHERLDGSGYPHGLKGEAIMPEARVLALADVTDSMASHRPYRPAQPVEAIIAELERGRGTLYDPAAVDAYVRLHQRGELPQPAVHQR